MSWPTLEGLPPEVLILILQAIPLRCCLKGMVHASPVIHEVYRDSRLRILRNLLNVYYNDLVIRTDAVTAVRSRGLCIEDYRNVDDALILLEKRRQMAFSRTASTNELAALLRLHEKAEWFLRDFEKTVTCLPTMSAARWSERLPMRLSVDEKRRFFRGFYRLEIWCNIFGRSNFCINEQFPVTIEYSRMVSSFFLTMPPWEMEEVGCVWWILRNRLVHALRADFIYHTPHSGPIENFSSLVMRGPRLVYRILHESGNERYDTIRENYDASVTSMSCFFTNGYPFNRFADSINAGNHPFRKPANQWNNLDFEGYKKKVESLPKSHQPGGYWHGAWCLSVFTKEPNFVYQTFVHSFEVSSGSWAWALWDAERIKEWRL
ncbi:hypothetical protein BDV18DRAFT_30509 [Aspergillus unguis]